MPNNVLDDQLPVVPRHLRDRGETGMTYVVTTADIDKAITVRATAHARATQRHVHEQRDHRHPGRRPDRGRPGPISGSGLYGRP